ncbi:MAG: AMP-binding protein, partial [Sphingomicrobium sp.]
MSDAIQPLTIGRSIRSAAAAQPHRAAIIAGARTLTYGELAGRINRVAHFAIGHLKVEPGDRIALLASNRFEYLELVAGLADAGAIIVTLNPRLHPGEIQSILDDCSPRWLIAADECSEALASAEASGVPAIRLDHDYEPLIARAASGNFTSHCAETDPFALAYTSGTTGKPKGVLLSHRSRSLTFAAMAAVYRCFGRGDRFLAMAPMCHGAGFAFACAPLVGGGTVELFPAGDMDALLTRLGARDVTGTFVVPTQLARLFELPRTRLEAGREHGLTSMISNAAALPQKLKEQAVEQFGPGIFHETYGSTEGGILTDIANGDLLTRPGSVGLPFPWVEIELRDESGRTVAAGEPGELFSRSPAGFSGYWQDPEQTAAAIVDGWITVGDVARRDADGFITIVDRKKDMVISGGINIYPREIENIIADLPGVSEAAVIGEPDSEWGERLHAFVVVAPGTRLGRDDVIALCRSRLSGFKV